MSFCSNCKREYDQRQGYQKPPCPYPISQPRIDYSRRFTLISDIYCQQIIVSKCDQNGYWKLLHQCFPYSFANQNLQNLMKRYHKIYKETQKIAIRVCEVERNLISIQKNTKEIMSIPELNIVTE